jgi:DNA polymerase III alpha subunit (gram-positive type)
LPEEFVVFDLETTGLNAQKNELIEIAAIKINKNATNHSFFESLVILKNKITPKVTKLNGITQELVDTEGKDLEPVLQEFLEFIGDLRLVAFN